MNAQIGDRIKLILMGADPDPIEPGSEGLVMDISHISEGPHKTSLQIDVTWDNGRGLQLIAPPDTYEIITRMEAKKNED